MILTMKQSTTKDAVEHGLRTKNYSVIPIAIGTV